MRTQAQGWLRHLGGDALRFLVAGIANTGLTLLVYQLLLFWMAASLAYLGAWLAGLVFVAVVYPNNVFQGGRQSMGDRALLATCYCAVFLCGLALLQGLQSLGVDARAAILVVVAATTLTNFFLSRKVLRR